MHITHLARTQLANLTTLDTHHLAVRTSLLILSHILLRLPWATNKWAHHMMASLSSKAMGRKESDTFLHQRATALEE
jgi:hypothetical protein